MNAKRWRCRARTGLSVWSSASWASRRLFWRLSAMTSVRRADADRVQAGIALGQILAPLAGPVTAGAGSSRRDRSGGRAAIRGCLDDDADRAHASVTILAIIHNAKGSRAAVTIRGLVPISRMTIKLATRRPRSVNRPAAAGDGLGLGDQRPVPHPARSAFPGQVALVGMHGAPHNQVAQASHADVEAMLEIFGSAAVLPLPARGRPRGDEPLTEGRRAHHFA